MPTGWAPFLALTSLLVTAVLALARQSQDAVLTPADTRRRQPSRSVLLANVAFTHGLVVFVLWAGIVGFGVPWSAVGAIGLSIADLGVGVGVGVLCATLNLLVSVIVSAFGIQYENPLRELLSPATHRQWIVLLLGALPAVAISEELLFRGALIGVTHAGFGTPLWALVGLSAFAFGVGHGAQGWLGIVVAGAFGVILAVVYVVFDSLFVVVVAHYLVNVLEFVVPHPVGQ